MRTIREIAPTDPLVTEIVDRHLALIRATSPACSVHAMDAERLSRSGARFFVALDGAEAVAIGAVKAVGPGHVELKSMHVLQEHRGAGWADVILTACIEAAREMGADRISLETGTRAAFAPARAFYKRWQFVECPPFEGYSPDPESVFMTRAI